uniref:Forkhead box protein M1 n=1 Tax=Ciona intestinalis TaxID=7719 RepID=Q4H3I0_CIOIN|nr:transcription factor protein [Ciona intestinalis]BAE06447.1 transcription factor protein [Ciona intestinalis]|eukprot:NP_001071993.1 transcription factor protein [Ciona intestinalis]
MAKNCKGKHKPKACRPIILQRKHPLPSILSSLKQTNAASMKTNDPESEVAATKTEQVAELTSEDLSQNFPSNPMFSSEQQPTTVKHEQQELTSSQPWNQTSAYENDIQIKSENILSNATSNPQQGNFGTFLNTQFVQCPPGSQMSNVMIKQEPGSHQFVDTSQNMGIYQNHGAMKTMYHSVPNVQMSNMDPYNQTVLNEVPLTTQSQYQTHGNVGQCNQFTYPYGSMSEMQAHSYAPNYYQQAIQPNAVHSGQNMPQPQPSAHFQATNQLGVQMPPNARYHIQGFSSQANFVDQAVDDSLTNITWLGRMGVNNFMPVPIERDRKVYERTEKRGRPPYSYMALIQFAINSSSTGKMTLRQIYQWIEEKFPYFKSAKPGWKNSIRHNLSLHDIFVRQVTTGSKASYWTLRSDLNIRPLTLDSVRGTSHHTFQDTSNPQDPSWSLQTVMQGQKPILPRLPQRPYILLPVPLINNGTNDKDMTQSTTTVDVQTPSVYNSTPLPTLHTDKDNRRLSSQDGSSFLTDSGFISDLSMFTPSNCLLNSVEKRLQKKSATSDSSPLLSQTQVLSGKKGTTKKSRKEPLKTLNDSLNSSLNFEKNEDTSPGKLLASNCSQFLVSKQPVKKEKPKTPEFLKKSAMGLTEDSFDEMLEDLGSPFKSYFTKTAEAEAFSTPRANTGSRKRRCSWGSPESSKEVQNRIKTENEVTLSNRSIRRVKSCVGDLRQNYADEVKNNLAIVKTKQVPTSTPLNKQKWQKSKGCDDMNIEENKENVMECFQQGTKHTEEHWDKDENGHHSIPSPIHSTSKNPEFDFFHDLIGSVFKTPDKRSNPGSNFDNLTPERIPLCDITQRQKPNPAVKTEAATTSDSLGPPPALLSPKFEPLDTSFSKLLDISGGSGTFSRMNTHFSDVADLSLSWSNFSHL